jgi:diketogulonate reductase-like aldo/keto reductase
MIAIPGTTKPARLESNWRSRDVELDQVELSEMRAIVDAAKPVGERYGEKNARLVGH